MKVLFCGDIVGRAGRDVVIKEVPRLRRELGLNQSAMAAEIGVSPSYLNHLERNQRPVTAGVLLRLAEAYDVDLKSVAAEGGEGTGVVQLAEIFADPMFGGFAVPRYELVEMADNAPAAADAVSRLYAALIEMRRRPAAQDGEAAAAEPAPPQRRSRAGWRSPPPGRSWSRHRLRCRPRRR